MENRVIDPTTVKGWAVDANPENDPTYPMKHYKETTHEGYSWERPPLQPEVVEVLHSIERPNISATYGTSVPPAGVSGMLRRQAFKYSESSYAHWLPLVLADRVGVVEGIVSDLASGQIPNIPGELGVKAELDHNRKEFLTRALVGAALATAVVLYVRSKRDE